MDFKLIFLCILVAHVNCQEDRPNIVILFADDLGWGDLESYGHPTSTTPNLNKMAQEGLRFMNFYSTCPVCSPSRSSLLTGRYQVRTGVYAGVFSCGSIGGMLLNETTIAAQLKTAGYATAILGKWHLGVGLDQQYLPTKFGFDHYLGIPYSHDMCPCYTCFYPNQSCFDMCREGDTPCPLFENDTIIQQPADFLTLSQRYSTAATSYIHQMADHKTPFFLYMAFQHTHHPQFASKMFTNSSIRGMFGDALNELDWEVGQIFNAINEAGIEDNTFVFFTADNGPSLVREVRGGNAGLLRCGKGSTFEGGMRVPGIAWWPGKITPGKTLEMAATIDLFPTILKITNIPLPDDRIIDGVDMSSILFDNEPSLRDYFIHYPAVAKPTNGIFAIRHKEYKAHYFTEGTGLYPEFYPDEMCRPSTKLTQHNPPLLYNLNHDPGELNPLNATLSPYKEIVEEINKIKANFESTVVWAISEIGKGKSNAAKPCAQPGCNNFPRCCTTTSSLHEPSTSYRFV